MMLHYFCYSPPYISCEWRGKARAAQPDAYHGDMMAEPQWSERRERRCWGFSQLSFTWVSPLIARASRQELTEEDATFLSTAPASTLRLAEAFEASYYHIKEQDAARGKTKARNVIPRVLVSLYWKEMVVHSLWVLTEVAIR